MEECEFNVRRAERAEEWRSVSSMYAEQSEQSTIQNNLLVFTFHMNDFEYGLTSCPVAPR